MRFDCSQFELNARLSLLCRIIPSRPSHPILANILLVADQELQVIRLTAFDLAIGLELTLPTPVEEGGKLTLPGKLLNDIISKAEGELNFERNGDLLTIKSQSGKYQVRGMGADEFPQLPSIENAQSIELPVVSFLEGLKGSIYCTSSDETKQLLTGVHLKIDPKESTIEFAATDGHRLGVVKLELESVVPAAKEPVAITIPAKALRELERMIALSPSDTLLMQTEVGQIKFVIGSAILTSRLIEGNYPNYRQLIPNRFMGRTAINGRIASDALERVSVLSDQSNSIVCVDLDAANQEMTVWADAKDVGSGREQLGVQYEGGDLNIAFNIRYLQEAIKHIGGTKGIILQTNSPTSPAVLIPEENKSMQALIMPIQRRSV